MVPKTINAALAPLRKWIIDKEYNISETQKILEIKLKNINSDRIVTPESYVAIPALQAISYCVDSNDLRDLYANLLTKSVVNDTKMLVHLSFVEIIKQLSPDEAKLLKSLSANDSTLYPLIDLRIVNKENNYSIIVYNFTDVADGVCKYPDKVSSYIKNLERLKIVAIPWRRRLCDDEVYEPLIKHEAIYMIMNKVPEDGWKYEIKKRVFEITSFGYNFLDVCVKDIDGSIK